MGLNFLGYDYMTLRIGNVSGEEYPETLSNIKIHTKGSNMSWTRDNLGLFCAVSILIKDGQIILTRRLFGLLEMNNVMISMQT